MLLVPHLRLLFDGCGLGTSHSVDKDFGEILAVFLATGAGQHRPEVCFVCILRQTMMPTPIEQAQLVLGRHIAMLGRFGKPSGRFIVVWLDCLFFIALGEEKAQCIFGAGVTSFC